MILHGELKLEEVHGWLLRWESMDSEGSVDRH